MYKSIVILNKYGNWLFLSISSGITVRCMTTFFSAYVDGEFPKAWAKNKKLFCAGIIGVSIGGFITFLKRYYFGEVL